MKKIICILLLVSSGLAMAQTSETLVTIHGKKVQYDQKMTTLQRNAIFPKVEGTLIYNTDTKCHEFWDGFGWYNYCWRGYDMPNQPSSGGTAIVTSYDCLGTLSGSMTVGSAVSNVSKIITATISKEGSYKITAQANGVEFKGEGTFSLPLGNKTVVLTATGVPTTAGPNNYALNTTPATCSFNAAVNNVPLAITTQPTAPAIVCSGSGTQTITVVAAGATTYQWKKDGTNISNGGVISGATSATLTLNNPTTANAGSYTVVVGNGTTTVTSNAVTSSITALPTITGVTGASRTGTGTVTLSATASGGATINWYTAGGTALYTGASYSPSVSATTTYYVEAAANGCISATRTAVTATVTVLASWDVVSPKTGRIWMDKNLGATAVATQARQKTAAGSLFQWGRDDDGHQVIDWDNYSTSPFTTTKAVGDGPAGTNFIKVTGDPYNWSTTQNDLRWTGSGGINNPCPSGYHVPTTAEWSAEIADNALIANGTALNSFLKLIPAGWRDNDGAIAAVQYNYFGYYWTSTTTHAQGLDPKEYDVLNVVEDTYAGGAYIMEAQLPPAFGAAVRCIKN